MAWKTHKSLLTLPLLTLALLVLVSGCGPSKEQLKIQDLQAEVDQLKNDLADRDRQMNDALVREDDARDTIDELNRQLAKARAESEKVKEVGGWISTPGLDMISIPGEVLFPSGKSRLTSAGRDALRRIAADIHARYADRDIYIFGHTDAQPIRKSKWKDNLELGAQRALNVVRTLHEYGIPYESMVQASCGEYRPKISSGRRKEAQNRRVEFYAVRRNAGIIENTTARRNGDY